MGIVRFEPDQQATPPDSYLIPRGTILRSVLRGDERTACEYRTAHDVQLWPLRLNEARYYTRDVSQLELPDSLRGRAALRFRLQTAADIPLKTLKLDRLPFFLRGADETPGAIYEQIFSRGTAVVVQAVTEERKKPRTILPAASIRRVGFREEESLLPSSPRGFTGYRLLREYFAFPQRFLFIELTGLSEAFRNLEGNQVDLIIVLSDQEVRLEERRIDASFFELYCTPVINLFAKRADRILISDRSRNSMLLPIKPALWISKCSTFSPSPAMEFAPTRCRNSGHFILPRIPMCRRPDFLQCIACHEY